MLFPKGPELALLRNENSFSMSVLFLRAHVSLVVYFTIVFCVFGFPFFRSFIQGVTAESSKRFSVKNHSRNLL